MYNSFLNSDHYTECKRYENEDGTFTYVGIGYDRENCNEETYR